MDITYVQTTKTTGVIALWRRIPYSILEVTLIAIDVFENRHAAQITSGAWCQVTAIQWRNVPAKSMTRLFSGRQSDGWARFLPYGKRLRYELAPLVLRFGERRQGLSYIKDVERMKGCQP